MPDQPAGQRRPAADDQWWIPPLEPPDPDDDGWPDPDSGPPDGEDAWLAELAPPQFEALAAAAAAAAAPPAREPVPAGFTHRPDAALATRTGWQPGESGVRPASTATGFGSGGPLDLAPPGPVLAALAQDVIDGGLAALSDDELIGLLAAARRMTSWQAATELAVAAELDARRQGDRDPVASSAVSEHVSAELAAALTLTGRAADTLLGLARDLTRLPQVLAALRSGLIDLPKGRVFTNELSALDDVAANQIAARYLGRAPGWTTSELRRALRAAVLAHDPAAARSRAAKARGDARVETWQEGSGNAAISGRELPAADAIAADERISQIARDLKQRGAAGTLDQLRAAVYLALLLGTDPVSLLDAGTAARPGTSAANPPTGHLAPAAASGLGGTIHLTLPALTWLGLASRPGELAGLGPIDPYTSRDLADLLAATGTASWHVTLTDPDGRAAAHACPRGQPPARANGPPATPDPRIGWLAGLTFDWLERGDCRHLRQTHAYQAGRVLRHLLEIRNPVCTAPGCRRPARHCDIDHTVPYDKGGMTCECNCGPVCRKHHRAKQAPGWHLAQPSPGVLVWTSPAGRTYTTHPDTYAI